ncbi:MAG TPA: glycerate kinase [Coleofasciculaceae cyanobacterium]
MSQPNPSLSQILSNWAAGKAPTELEWQQLVDEERRSPQRAEALGIPLDNVEEAIQARSHLFQSVYPNVLSLPSFQTLLSIREAAGELENCEPFKTKIALSLWNLWLPLAIQLASLRQQLNRPLIQGILGGQGTGKTTLAAVLSLILQHLGYRTLSLSLDDLYKTYAERQYLQQSDPRLIWRGPPGTHDVALGLQLLDQLRQPTLKQPILVPRFDKSAWGGAGDRTTSESVEGVDIVLFEGWFVGVRPIDSSVFDGATPEPIQTAADRIFARDINERLQDYLPLWERLDRLMVLMPTDYRLSQSWRRQAEQQMMATRKSGMTNTQVDEFVEYFWKSLHPELFITPLTRNSSVVNLVVAINPDHSIGTIYCPDDPSVIGISYF